MHWLCEEIFPEQTIKNRSGSEKLNRLNANSHMLAYNGLDFIYAKSSTLNLNLQSDFSDLIRSKDSFYANGFG